MTVMILPAGLRCNLRCVYCYHEGDPRCSDFSGNISHEILKKIIGNSADLAENVDFLWHGGEPLLAGINHFKKAIDIENRTIFKGKVRNMVQTNATLLNKRLCDFFNKHGFMISTSLDGPPEENDVNRIFANHSGTHHYISRAIKLWKSYGNKIGAVALVTKSNVKKPRDVYYGLKKSGLTSCSFHFCSQDDAGSVRVVPTIQEAASFFKSVFDLWLNDDDPEFPIRNFRNILRVLCGGNTVDCASRKDGCLGFIAITANGDVYPCHRFVNRPNFKIGNILKQNLVEIYDGAANIYSSMCRTADKCNNCEWLKMCGGGCAYERLVSHGSLRDIHPACELKKEIFSYVKERTKNLLKII